MGEEIKELLQCDLCTKDMESHIATRENAYHYDLSGLDHIRLIGITVHTCTHCGVEVPEIPCVEQLNQFIAGVITKKPNLLTGSEIRFLRNRAGFSSKQFAEMLGISPEHLSRIENTKESSTMGTPTDRLVRLIAMDSDSGDKVRTFLSRLKRDTTVRRPKNVEFIRNVHKGKDTWTRIQGLVAA